MDPGEGSSAGVGKESNTQYSVEWPTDCFLEEPGLIHQEWPMNSQFDLNLGCHFDSQFDLNLDCNFQGSEKAPIDVNQQDNREVSDDGYDFYKSDDSGCGNVDVDGRIELEPELFPSSDAHVDEDVERPQDVDEVEDLEELNRAAMARAARRAESKAKATKARKFKQRIAAGTKEDAFVISDSCSSDIKDITDSSDDDRIEFIFQRCASKSKSRAKALKDRVYYDDKKNNAHERLEVDICFLNVREVRKAIENYHIAYTRNFTYLKNNQERVVACCSSGGTCSFMFISSAIRGESTHCIRQLNLPHTCGTSTETSRINSSWIAKKYEDLIRSDPHINISIIQETIMREHGVEISKHMAYRGKNKALEAVQGDADLQYARLKDYMLNVMEKNVGSRCSVATINPTGDPQQNPRFHGLFFGLHAQLEGFKKGCRPFIGIDGCFLKLGNGAQVLAATARDGNNNLFPIAFGVVGSEDTATWSWFLNQLKYALGGTSGQFGNYTFMSDRQKGILGAEGYQICLRHIYANFKTAGYKSGDLKLLIDRVAYAFDKYDYDRAMADLKRDDEGAWEWIKKVPPRHWARHALDTHYKTDLVVNNLSEVFNSYINCVRDKPIVTMIDSIRTKLMSRFAAKRDGVETAQWEITPTYVERDLWQVTGFDRTYEVNLSARTCGCFKWDLTGIPCRHAICAINKSKQFPEDFVSEFFKKPTYKEAYKNLIYPVPGQHGWSKSGTRDIDPPMYDTKRGRKQKKRRRGADEPSKTNVQKRMTSIKCSNCKVQGHRYTNCAQALKPHLAARKAGHKTVRSPVPPPHHSGPAPVPPTHQSGPAPVPPQQQRRPGPGPPPVNSSSQALGVTGRSFQSSGSHLGPRGYEHSWLYSYFTAGLGHYTQESSTSQQE